VFCSSLSEANNQTLGVLECVPTRKEQQTETHWETLIMKNTPKLDKHFELKI
jgi:hypothetical protein